jgi:hypothetical protein
MPARSAGGTPPGGLENLISAVGALRPLIGDIAARSPGGHLRGARQEQAGSWDAVRGAAHTDTTPVRLHHLAIDAHDCPGCPGSGRMHPAGG